MNFCCHLLSLASTTFCSQPPHISQPKPQEKSPHRLAQRCPRLRALLPDIAGYFYPIQRAKITVTVGRSTHVDGQKYSAFRQKYSAFNKFGHFLSIILANIMVKMEEIVGK